MSLLPGTLVPFPHLWRLPGYTPQGGRKPREKNFPFIQHWFGDWRQYYTNKLLSLLVQIWFLSCNYSCHVHIHNKYLISSFIKLNSDSLKHTICILLRLSSMSCFSGYYQVCSYSGESTNRISIYLSEIENLKNWRKRMSLNMQCKWVNFIKGKDKKIIIPLACHSLRKFFLRIMSFKYALYSHLFIHSIQLIFVVHSFIHPFSSANLSSTLYMQGSCQVWEVDGTGFNMYLNNSPSWGEKKGDGWNNRVSSS